MLGLDKDKVMLVAYDKNWAVEYKKEKECLLNIIGEYILDIQHVGSTSIEGLSAKPIIDIAVAVENVEVLGKLIPILSEAGYDVKNSIDDLGEVLARKGSPENRTHYIHIEIKNSTFWNNHILFRDYLLKYPKYVKEYEELKQQIALKFGDERKKYTAEKNEFISMILNQARDELINSKR